MTRLSSLVAAVRSLQDGPAAATPVTIVCSPGARDDIVLALAEANTQVNVQVQTLTMLVEAQFPTMLHGPELAQLVTKELHQLPESSILKQKGLAEEPATRIGVRRAVEKLLHSPREQWAATGGRTLPQEIAQIAERIATTSAHILPCDAWSQVSIPERTIVWDVVATNPAEDRLLARLPKPLAPTTTAESERKVVADEHTQALAVLHTVRNQLATTPLHRIGVALLRPEFGPVLLDAAEDLKLQLHTGATYLEDPAVATLLALLDLEVDDMPRSGLATALQRGQITWSKEKGEKPKLHAFDRQSRKKDKPRTWPRWESADDSTEIRWILALRQDLIKIRNTNSWTQWADRVTDLVHSHLNFKKDDQWFLESMRQYDALGIDFSPLAAKEALWEVAATSPLGEKENKGLRVGTLESFAGCDLDLLIICNASSTCLPHGLPEEPGLSWEQRDTSTEREAQRQEEVFASALRSADKVIFLHPQQLAGGEFGGSPSLWTSNASRTTYTTPDGKTVDVVHEASNFPNANKRTLAFLRAAAGELPIATQQSLSVLGDRDAGATHSEFNGFLPNYTDWIHGKEFSASALNEYIRSPYLYFLKQVAQLYEFEADPADDLASKDSGTVFHEIVENWTKLVWLDATPRPMSASDIDWDEARTTLDTCIDKALSARLLESLPALSRLTFSEQLRRGLTTWFKEERERAHAGWVPLGVEHSFGKDQNIQATVATPLGEISFRGNIDRIEYHPGERILRVVDYKTGRSHLSKDTILDWEDPKKFSVQPYLYGFAMSTALHTGTIKELLIDAGFPTAEINPEIHICFYYINQESDKRYFSDTYNVETNDEFVLFLLNLLELLEAGLFYPREIDNGMWGPRSDVLRLGANNYARQAAALTTTLRTHYESLSANPAELTTEDNAGEED
ncbi:PD-(D/E)XK nuclease family protein [Corynebacterium epidermidicanis]|uniref:PD-(D/E)XK nuclease superfamily n=1 Tax=Corynebacterium epidermidicanis TaxID=1050174 RepID=A0A0G3GY09_9CORY|nr:PD-(D/E)XK nuclease family protein [Corynebacterium epidermidicanis]AKK03707.1 PD-(D/E)XK nuclease superfamily [Corynebacterium epidermidicanis]